MDELNVQSMTGVHKFTKSLRPLEKSLIQKWHKGSSTPEIWA